jgi:hypothetical protein
MAGLSKSPGHRFPFQLISPLHLFHLLPGLSGARADRKSIRFVGPSGCLTSISPPSHLHLTSITRRLHRSARRGLGRRSRTTLTTAARAPCAGYVLRELPRRVRLEHDYLIPGGAPLNCYNTFSGIGGGITGRELFFIYFLFLFSSMSRVR